MKIKQITLFPLTLKLKHPFITNHGQTDWRPLTLVEITLTSGTKGYGEIQAFADDSYAPQTQKKAIASMPAVIPHLIGINFKHPRELSNQLNQLTSFARASLEMALWDAYGKTLQQPLAQLLADSVTPRRQIAVGMVIGMQTDVEQTTIKIRDAVRQGYRKIKFKTNNYQTALQLIEIARQIKPDLITTLDANQAWANNSSTLANLQKLEKHGLSLIEEPLQKPTLGDNAQLQAQLPQLQISLDESLTDLSTIKSALFLKSANAFTLKQGKLGGITTTLESIDLIEKDKKIPWIGGMLTSGLGRSVDLALAAQLTKDQIPADISASSNYFEQDYIKEKLTINNGMIKVPNQPGIGVTIDWSAIKDLQTAPPIQYK